MRSLEQTRTERVERSHVDDQAGSQHRSTSLLHGRGGQNLHRQSHRIPASQYVALGVWLMLLLLQYSLVRFGCNVGVPPDHTDDDDVVRVLDDFQFLLFAGFVLAVLTGVHWPDRFLYIFCFDRRSPRGILFLTVYFMSGIGWGLLDLVPVLGQFTLTGIDAKFMVILVALLVGGIFLVGLHLWLAFKYNSWHGFFAYIISRGALLAFYATYLIVKLQPENNSRVIFHFHHYAVGFLIASLCEFNHPLSITLLAVGTGIFVQGIAAYDADPILAWPQYRIFCKSGSEVRESPLMSSEAATFVLRYCRAK